MSFKNPLLRKIVRWASLKSKRAAHPPEKILVASTTALGDTLWSMPALESLKLSFPNSHLSVLTSKIGLEILENNPWTQAHYLLKDPVQLWKKLRGQFDTILIFHTSQRIVTPLCASLGASRVVGLLGAHKGLDDLLTDSIASFDQHYIERRLRLVERIGGKAHSNTLSFFLKPEEKKTFTGTWIALHPGANDEYKLWPLDHFATLGRALKETLNCEILITGSAFEKPLMEELSRRIPGSHLADSHLSLRAFAGLLSGLDLLICNDSGPFHLASALKIPAIGLYSPTDPLLCGPHHCPTSIALSKPKTCTPCLARKCKVPFCLLQISPQAVLKKAVEMLNKT